MTTAAFIVSGDWCNRHLVACVAQSGIGIVDHEKIAEGVVMRVMACRTLKLTIDIECNLRREQVWIRQVWIVW